MRVDAPSGVPPKEALDEIIGDARVVLIGESSHGTAEFYQARAEITKWLIEEKGFCAVAAEADWPDAYRVNRYVRGGQGTDGSADEALRGFERFPSWMWRNTVVRDFVGWLRAHNASRRAENDRETGFYGLDLYSLHRSMQEVVDYLDNVDPVAAQRARERYACFDRTSRPTTASPTGMPRLSAPECPVNGRWSTSWWICSAMGCSMRAATDSSPRTTCSTRSRTR